MVDGAANRDESHNSRRESLGFDLTWSYLFALFVLVYHADAFARKLCDDLSFRTGETLGHALSIGWAPASTALGVPVLAAFAILVLLTLPRIGREVRLPALLIAVGVLVASVIIYMVAAWQLTALYQGTRHFATLPQPGDVTHAGQHSASPVTWITPLYLMYPMTYQIILAGLLFGGWSMIQRWIPQRVEEAPITGRGSWLRRGVVLAPGIICVGSILLIWSPLAHYGSLAGMRVFVHQKHLDLRVPVYGSYGDRAGGMFGQLPAHLEARGCHVTAEPLTDGVRLDNYDVLVLINLQERFSEADKRRILDFVRHGGGLLIAGDHTGMAGLREPANHLVDELGIALNFDSAKPFSIGFVNGLDYVQHPVTRRLPWWTNEANVWVGASLDVRFPAYPLILARYAFSDPGDFTSPRGQLGDLKYSPGERLGDLPVAAAREYGRGRIVVWGDTSPLQNGAWLFSHRYMERTIGWLGGGGGAALPPWIRVPAGFLLFISGAALGLLPRTWKGRATAMVLVIAGVVAAKSYGDTHHPECGSGSGNRAYIDIAHLPDTNLDTWLRDGFAGFAQTLSRSGLLGYALSDWDHAKWDDAALLAFLSPMKPLDTAEQRQLRAFVAQGGHVLIALGWEESAGWRPYLRSIGLEVQNVPLGKVEGTSWRGETVKFENAWPIAVRHSAEFKHLTLAEADGRPLAVRLEHSGGGSITLVGDSRFLRNGNLEGRSEVVEENIAFLRAFLEEHVLPQHLRPKGAAGDDAAED